MTRTRNHSDAPLALAHKLLPGMESLLQGPDSPKAGGNQEAIQFHKISGSMKVDPLKLEN